MVAKITQASLGRTTKPVAHISLNFSAQDKERLTEEKMVEVASEYLDRMGYGRTQAVVVRHSDRDHPHVHLVVNRIGFDGRRISDQNERLRSTKVCRELTEKYGLYVTSGKEQVKRHRLREPEATKYRIYDSLARHVPRSRLWGELQSRLCSDGIEVGFKTKGTTAQVEGVRFTENGLTFNGSKVDRQFSYSQIDFALRQNHRTEQHPSPSPHEALGGLFGAPVLQSEAMEYQEEAFRRRMHRKKKKGLKR